MGGCLLGLICARLATEAYREAVPGVDGGDRECEVDQLLIAEVRANSREDFVGNVVLSYQGDCFCPFQGRAFAFAVEWHSRQAESR
jgi:hypothetical protein